MNPDDIHHGTVVRIDSKCSSTKAHFGWILKMDKFLGTIQKVDSIKWTPIKNQYRVYLQNVIYFVWHPDDLQEMQLKDMDEIRKPVLFNEEEIVEV